MKFELGTFYYPRVKHPHRHLKDEFIKTLVEKRFVYDSSPRGPRQENEIWNYKFSFSEHSLSGSSIESIQQFGLALQYVTDNNLDYSYSEYPLVLFLKKESDALRFKLAFVLPD